MTPTSELDNRAKNFDKSFGSFTEGKPPQNPEKLYQHLKDIADKVNTEDQIEINKLFFPYWKLTSREQLHQLLVYVWGGVLGPVESRLFRVCGDIVKICSTAGASVETSAEYARKAKCYQDIAFSPPPVLSKGSIRIDEVVDDIAPLAEPSFGLDEDPLVFPTFDLANSEVTRLHLARCVVMVLSKMVNKRNQLEHNKKVLKDWLVKIKELEEKKSKELEEKKPLGI